MRVRVIPPTSVVQFSLDIKAHLPWPGRRTRERHTPHLVDKEPERNGFSFRLRPSWKRRFAELDSG
jgi:hypothetical protein